MTNFEYYKEQLKEIAGKKIGVFNGEPNRCIGMECSKCDLDACNNQERYSHNCEFALTQWYLDEHIEKPTITKQERAFLEICNPECYIARDKTGKVYLYDERPVKGNRCNWYVKNVRMESVIMCLELMNTKVFNISNTGDIFSFITWEDEEPWKLEDLLKLEVK